MKVSPDKVVLQEFRAQLDQQGIPELPVQVAPQDPLDQLVNRALWVLLAQRVRVELQGRWVKRDLKDQLVQPVSLVQRVLLEGLDQRVIQELRVRQGYVGALVCQESLDLQGCQAHKDRMASQDPLGTLAAPG